MLYLTRYPWENDKIPKTALGWKLLNGGWGFFWPRTWSDRTREIIALNPNDPAWSRSLEWMLNTTNSGKIKFSHLMGLLLNGNWEAEMIWSDSPTAILLKVMMEWIKNRTVIITIWGVNWINPNECAEGYEFELDGKRLTKDDFRKRFSDVALIQWRGITDLKILNSSWHMIFDQEVLGRRTNLLWKDGVFPEFSDWNTITQELLSATIKEKVDRYRSELDKALKPR